MFGLVVLSKSSLRLLYRELAAARRKIKALEESLELEHHENREAERHWANALIRAKQGYPLTKEQPSPKPPAPLTFEKVVDKGELEALTETARSMGFDDPKAEAERILRAEHGFD